MSIASSSTMALVTRRLSWLPMAVTRCVCYRMSFAELLAMAQANGWTTVAQISLETNCGMGCGGCRPYLQAMLDTKATCFAVRDGENPPRPCAPEPWDK
jgi:NAD(P)H-nitrite reductase large subunit